MSCITDYLGRVHVGERSGPARHTKGSLIQRTAVEEQGFTAWLCQLTLLCPSPLTRALAIDQRRDERVIGS